MEIIEFLAVLLLAVFSGACTIIFAYFYIFRLRILEGVTEILVGNVLELLTRDEELQKMMYQVGGMIGSGVKGGIGLNPPKSGRFKWQDLLVDLASQYFTNVAQVQTPSPSPQPQPQPQRETNKKW